MWQERARQDLEDRLYGSDIPRPPSKTSQSIEMDPMREVPEVSAPDLSIAPNATPETLTPPPKVIYATEEFKRPYDRPTPGNKICICGSTFTLSRNYYKHMLACRVLNHAELRPNPKYETQDDAKQETSNQADLLSEEKFPLSPIIIKGGEASTVKTPYIHDLTNLTSPLTSATRSTNASSGASMMDMTIGNDGSIAKLYTGSEGPRPLNLITKFDQAEEVQNYSQEVVDIAHIVLATSVKSIHNAHERHLHSELNRHREALSSRTTSIDDAESHYLAIESIYAMIQLQVDYQSLKKFDQSLQYTGKTPARDHICMSTMLLNRKALSRVHRSCTKLCTLTPGCMYLRQVILRKVQLSQVNVALFQHKCWMQDKKKKVDHQWFLNNRAKEYLRQLELQLAKGSSYLNDDELWQHVKTAHRKKHPQSDYLSFDHIPAVVREVYALKWKMHGFTRTSDDYDDELAILECIQVGGGGLIAVRERYDFVESEVKHMELYFQLNPIKRKFIRLLLILSPNHLDPDRKYLPFQEPLHYRYCFETCTDLLRDYPLIHAQMQTTSLYCLYIAAAMRVGKIKADPESVATEVDIGNCPQLQYMQGVLLATASSKSQLDVLKKATSNATFKAICSRIRTHIYEQKRQCLGLLARQLVQTQHRVSSLVLSANEKTLIKIQVSATASLHKKRADVEAKCAKLIQHCFQVDKLSQDLTSFIDTFFEILQSDFMTQNKDGGKLINKIFDDFLQELMQCFVTKQFKKSKWLIKEVKQLKYLAKSVAETSLSEAMLVLENYGRIINNLTLVVTLSKTTVEDALFRYPEDEDLLTISEQANAYDHPDYPLIGVTNRTQGYGKMMMERQCYLIKTPTDLMVIMANNIESLTKFTRRFVKARQLTKLNTGKQTKRQYPKRYLKSQHKMTLRERKAV